MVSSSFLGDTNIAHLVEVGTLPAYGCGPLIEAATSMRRTRSPAIRLLRRLLATEWCDPTYIAQHLVVSPQTLDAFVAGRESMPLDRQLRLAAFVIEQVPPFARAACRLRAQVSAAMRCDETDLRIASPQSTTSIRDSVT